MQGPAALKVSSPGLRSVPALGWLLYRGRVSWAPRSVQLTAYTCWLPAGWHKQRQTEKRPKPNKPCAVSSYMLFIVCFEFTLTPPFKLFLLRGCSSERLHSILTCVLLESWCRIKLYLNHFGAFEDQNVNQFRSTWSTSDPYLRQPARRYSQLHPEPQPSPPPNSETSIHLCCDVEFPVLCFVWCLWPSSSADPRRDRAHLTEWRRSDPRLGLRPWRNVQRGQKCVHSTWSHTPEGRVPTLILHDNSPGSGLTPAEHTQSPYPWKER